MFLNWAVVGVIFKCSKKCGPAEESQRLGQNIDSRPGSVPNSARCLSFSLVQKEKHYLLCPFHESIVRMQ